MKTSIEKIGGKNKIVVSYRNQSFAIDYEGNFMELKWYKSMFDKMIKRFKSDLLKNKSDRFVLNQKDIDSEFVNIVNDNEKTY